MDVLLSVDGGSADDLDDLQRWLQGESELRGRVRQRQAQPAPGELGTVTDALMVALGAGGTLSVLAASLQVWFAQPRRSDVRMKIRTAAGETVEIDAKRVANAEALIREILDRAAP